MVTTSFAVTPDPLELDLASAADLCTADTASELSWEIEGGKPSYALTIDGQAVSATAGSADVNCGPLLLDALTGEPLLDQYKTFQAVVTDQHSASANAETTVEVVGAGAPLLSARTAASGSVALSWSIESTSGVTHWQYRRQQGDGPWGSWTTIAGSDAATTEHTVSGLTMDARYRFHLRAVSGATAGHRSGTAVATAGLTPTVHSEREVLLYDDLDSSGGAAQPGAYALLTDAADMTSGATTFAQVSNAEALLLNTIGANGRDFTSILDIVQAGDQITWSLGATCWYHYRITNVVTQPASPPRKLLRLSLENEDQCGFTQDQKADTTYFDGYRDRVAYFGWDNPPNKPEIGSDGIRILPHGYPVDGGHSYRLRVGGPTSIVIDVPQGMRLTYLGYVWSSGPSGTFLYATYVDEVSGGTLGLDPTIGDLSGFRVPRVGLTPIARSEAIKRFEHLIASIREQRLP